MRRRILIVPTLTTTFVLLLSLPGTSAAQGTIGAGLSFLRGGGNKARGAQIDYAATVHRMRKFALSAVGDFSLYRQDFDVATGTQTLYQGGIRITATNSPRVRPFGQFLVGVWHATFQDFSDNVATFTVDGGVDVPISPRINFRGSIGFPTGHRSGLTHTDVRYTLGLSFPIGATP